MSEEIPVYTDFLGVELKPGDVVMIGLKDNLMKGVVYGPFYSETYKKYCGVKIATGLYKSDNKARPSYKSYYGDSKNRVRAVICIGSLLNPSMADASLTELIEYCKSATVVAKPKTRQPDGTKILSSLGREISSLDNWVSSEKKRKASYDEWKTNPATYKAKYHSYYFQQPKSEPDKIKARCKTDLGMVEFHFKIDPTYQNFSYTITLGGSTINEDYLVGEFNINPSALFSRINAIKKEMMLS